MNKLPIGVITLYIATLFVDCASETKTHNATRIDLMQCKLTHFGTEYQGQKGTTGGGIRCQFWHTQNPLHKISSEIKDSDFPERSMKTAKNYCRNPTRDPKGPWCYTMEPTLIDDECGVPLCNYGECRISGTGAEYGGTKKTSATGRKCKSWDIRHKLVEGRAEKFSKKKFPELSRSKAKSFCRNPNDDTGGPWCYVEDENFETMEKEYCDIPFCDDKDCLIYARNASVYSTITKLNETYGNITLWVKLWNPSDEQNAEARLLLSLVPIPTSAKRIAQDWRAGVEIVISNSGSGQTYPTSEDEQDFENTPNILLGSKWTGIWINWGGGMISVGLYGSMKPLFMDEYKKKNKISSLYPDSFLYYGLMGTGVLWSTEFCQEECEVHTTFGMEYLRVWPLQPSNTTVDIRFKVRASKDISIRLYQSPGSLFPCFTVTIGDADAITMVYEESETSKVHLKDAPGKNLLDFWVWKDFTLSIFGPHLRLFSERVYGNEEILYLKDNLFGTIRWFSVGSRNNVAMWTFFCVPESDPVEAASPPNCITNLADYRYEGSQWTSVNEMPCTPWTSPEIPDDDKKNDLFVDGSAEKAINKCRNPGHDPKGPYCYSISLENSLTASKQYCPIRRCRSSECRMAGTGNDYVGTLAKTRSGRTCAEWMSSYDYERYGGGKNGIGKEGKTMSVTPKIKEKTDASTTSPKSTSSETTTPATSASTTSPKSTSSETTTPATSASTASTASTPRMWNVQDFLTRPKNFTFSHEPLPDDFDSDWKKTSVSKGTKSTSTTSPTTESTASTASTPRMWNVQDFLTRPKNFTFSHEPLPDDFDSDWKKTSVSKATKSTSTTSPTTESTASTASTPRMWNVQDFLTRPKNFTFSHEPLPDDFDSDWKKTSVSKATKSTLSTSPTTKSTASTESTPRMWNVEDFLTRPKNFTFSHEPLPDDFDSDWKKTSVSKATKRTLSTSPTTKSTASTESTPRMWNVEDFLTRPKNFTFSHEPLPDDFDSDWKKTSVSKKAKSTLSTSPTTESTMSKPSLKKSPRSAESSLLNSRVPNFLTRRETNTDLSWEPLLDHRDSDWSDDQSAVERSRRSLKPIHPVNPEYFNDTLYPEHSVRNASNYCRDPSRNIAGTWCYTTDPLVPQDLCDVRDCDMPEECIFLVKGHGAGRRLYVLPEHRSEGLHFSLKAWEPDEPDSITFVFTADDGLKSRYILKVGALDNEKVMLYYQGEEGAITMVKKKTLPHLLYLGKWSSFVIKIPRGQVLVYYQGAPNPLFQWDHPEPEKAFLPIYYYYTSELGHTIGVAFDCATRCHIENTQTDRFTRILPLTIWSKEPVANPNRLELMIRAEGVVLIPLLMFPGTPGYYAVTLGELQEWVFFLKNTYPKMNIYHKQKAPSALFTTNSWTNITLMWFNSTINVLWNGTLVLHYEHTHPLLFYFFSLAVDPGGWATWAANCAPSDIDGDPEDGGWSEWGPWLCSASCNGGVGTRKRVCNNPEPNIKGEPCLGPSIMSGRCNAIKCGDITEDTVNLIKRRIRQNHISLSVKEGHEITIPSDPDIIKSITTQSPERDIDWSHNGIFVNPDKDRLTIEDNNIVIKRAITNDSGVYTITLHRVDGTHMIFKMVTLVVYPVKSVTTIRETLPMTLVCHCVVLGYLYSDLKISWTLRHKLWKTYGTTLPISVNVDMVPVINKSHNGLWECVVEQNDLDFKWTTNAILVNVIGPPNWRNHLMEDEFTRPIFGWMPNETFVAVSALIIFLVLTTCIIIGTGLYSRFRESGKNFFLAGPTDSEVRKKIETPKLPSKTKESKTIGTRHMREENYDENISPKPRSSKIRRSRENDERPERKKLIADTETEESS